MIKNHVGKKSKYITKQKIIYKKKYICTKRNEQQRIHVIKKSNIYLQSKRLYITKKKSAPKYSKVITSLKIRVIPNKRCFYFVFSIH